MKASQTGLVLEGGGFRGIFTAGILDAFLANNLHFPYLIAVSAGAAYGVSYVSRQAGRNLAVNRVVSDKRYCSFWHYLRTGNYFNWDFVYREVPMQIVPFDYQAFSASGTVFRVGLTDCETGAATFHTLDGQSPEQFRDLLAATSALPLISRMQRYKGRWYMDGGIADALPVARAFEEGNERLVVILTRPAGYRKKASLTERSFPLIYRNFPKLAAVFRERVGRYNRSLDHIERLEAEGRVFVIRPPQSVLVSRMENNPEKLDVAYQLALEQGRQLIPDLIHWLTV